MKRKNMIASERICTGPNKKPHPGRKMAYTKRADVKDGHCWLCTRCASRRSIRAGSSFFEQSRIPLVLLFKLIVHWVLQTRYTKALGSSLGVKGRTMRGFTKRIRCVILADYKKTDLKLGGSGVIVEIDNKSLFGKVAYYHGNVFTRKQFWVIGMRERVSGRCYFEIVPSRDRERLLQIVYKRCKPGSVIVSDESSSFNDILAFDYRFQKEKSLINSIEIDWNECKSQFKRFRGCDRDEFQAYIDEFCWRRNCDRCGPDSLSTDEKILDCFIDALVLHYPVNGERKVKANDTYANYYAFEKSEEWLHDL